MLADLEFGSQEETGLYSDLLFFSILLLLIFLNFSYSHCCLKRWNLFLTTCSVLLLCFVSYVFSNPLLDHGKNPQVQVQMQMFLFFRITCNLYNLCIR